MSKFRCMPLVLSVLATGGLIATAVLTARATPKANDILDKHKDEDMQSKIKAVVPTYLPAILSGTATVICIFGIGTLDRKQQAALASAYALVTKQYQNYKKKVIEQYGEDAHKDILDSIKVEHVDKEHTIYTTGAISTSTLDFGSDDEECLFYDMYSERYFTSTIAKVLQAQYHLNRNYILGGCVTLNNFYEFLGIPTTDYGDKVGWAIEDDCYWIDFYNHVTKMQGDDGVDSYEVYVIDYQFEPTGTFLEYSYA